MEFLPLSKLDPQEAAKLAQAAFVREAKLVPVLHPTADHTQMLAAQLNEMFKDNPNGVGAAENGKLTGYLAFYGGIDNFFSPAKGAFSPLHGNAVAEGAKQGQLASRLFQQASRSMLYEGGITSYAVCLYAHDIEGLTSYFMNGFGARCSDAMCSLDVPLVAPLEPGFAIEEWGLNDAHRLFDLFNLLRLHLSDGPLFMYDWPWTMEEWLNRCQKKASRQFVLTRESEPIGYIEITSEGENFLSESEDTRNTCGAILRPEWRGSGLYTALLAQVQTVLKAEGWKRLGVDCETINPTALRFWGKHFTPYTYSVHRRIDERILEKQ